MEIPTRGWPKKAYDAMLACDKDEFDYAMTRCSIHLGEANANILALDLLGIMPDEVNKWWLTEDDSLPPVEETGAKNFNRAMADIDAEWRQE